MNKLVRPFRLVQPPRHLAHLVASRSYLSYNKTELQDKLLHNPYSYLQVINPDANKDINAKRGTQAYFRNVRAEYDGFLQKGWFEGTDGPGIAIYRLSTSERTFTGIISVLDLNRCNEGGIAIHEQTLESREELFMSYLECVGFHAEPILCARKSGHKGESNVDLLIEDITINMVATCDFSTTDRVRHTIWWVNKEVDNGLTKALGEIDKVYLADGHHRLASSYKLFQKYTDEPGPDRILAFVMPADELNILGYHRQVVEFPGAATDVVAQIEALNEVDRVLPLENDSAPRRGEIDIMHSGKSWRVVLSKDDKRVDASWLGTEVLDGLLGITDQRNDKRLKYIPGNRSKQEVAKIEGLVFYLHPIPIEQITDVADAGGHLPPKSTWVEPKMRSGLFVYEFGQHDHPKEYDES